MVELSPQALLTSSSIARPATPWCVVLDNLELALAFLAQPWIAGSGLRRADCEPHLAALASTMPIGRIERRHVNHALGDCEERGILHGSGVGPNRRSCLTPQGFAAFVLNLHVLQTDPTLDATEFEFKRGLATMWNATAELLMASEVTAQLAAEAASFFDRIDELVILDRPAITSEVASTAFNVPRLIACQRDRVVQLQTEFEGRLPLTRFRSGLMRAADFLRISTAEAGVASEVDGYPALHEIVVNIAAGGAAQLTVEAEILRCEAYLRYLDRLGRKYALESKSADFNAFRRHIAQRRAD